MIDLATAAAAAAMLNNSVSAVDKVYNWWRARQNEKPASELLRSDPQKKVLEFVSATEGQKPIRVVMTYDDLARKIDQDDFRFIQSFERRMKAAMAQWEKLNEDLPLADPVSRARIEANMEKMKDGDICVCLNQIVGFIEKLNIDLYDHYARARTICAPRQ